VMEVVAAMNNVAITYKNKTKKKEENKQTHRHAVTKEVEGAVGCSCVLAYVTKKNTSLLIFVWFFVWFLTIFKKRKANGQQREKKQQKKRKREGNCKQAGRPKKKRERKSGMFSTSCVHGVGPA
jgi:hypothetical protein